MTHTRRAYTIGDNIRGNVIKDVIDHIVYFECGRCGNPFERKRAQLRFYPPSSCGCCIKANHDKIMGRCFKEYRAGMNTQPTGDKQGAAQ